MKMVQTQFFEKKYRSFFDGTASEFQGQNFPYILFFQVNHLNSKEWIFLKNKFHEISPSTIHHMIPKRFLVQILQPHVFPEKTHSLYSLTESFGPGNLSSKGPIQGHSCFFFCQTFEEVQKFFQLSDMGDDLEKISDKSGPFGLSFQEPLVLSKDIWTKSQQKRFIPLGLFEKSQTQNFSFLFWNPYDMRKILFLTSQKISPYEQLITQALYPTMVQPLHMLQNFCSFSLFGRSSFYPFLYHHFEFYALLMMLSFKKNKNQNE